MSRYIQVKKDNVHSLIRKRGYAKWASSCSIGEMVDEDGDAAYKFDVTSPCWGERKKYRYVPASDRIPGPGTWLDALLTLTVIVRVLRPHCDKCNVRKKYLDKMGWGGLPRALITKAVWTGNKSKLSKALKCGGCGGKVVAVPA